MERGVNQQGGREGIKNINSYRFSLYFFYINFISHCGKRSYIEWYS